MIYRRLIIFVLFFCIVFITVDKLGSAETLKIGLMQDIGTLYPWKGGCQHFESDLVMQNIYETLFRVKRDGTEIEPWLAANYSASPDYKTWTIQIRKRILFHDGRPLNADAVVVALQLHPIFKNKIKKIDKDTVVFNLDEPNATFPATLANTCYSIVSPITAGCFAWPCKKNVYSGTGPFKLDHWTVNKEVVLKANKNYWNEKPSIHKAIFIPYQTENEIIQAIKKKTVKLVPAISSNGKKAISEISYLHSQSTFMCELDFLALNTEKKPFDDQRVRIAINHAINKTALIEKYFLNGKIGAVAKNFVPEQMLTFKDTATGQEYDPKHAKALLEEAGYSEGFNVILLITPARRPYLPDLADIADDISTDLSAIGIQVTIISPDSFANFSDVLGTSNYDMVLLGWLSATLDPNDFLTELLASKAIGSSNMSRWSNKKFDDLIQQAGSQIDPAKRLEIYQQAQSLFKQEMPFVPLWSPMLTTVWDESLKGYVPHPLNRLFLQYISFSGKPYKIPAKK